MGKIQLTPEQIEVRQLYTLARMHLNNAESIINKMVAAAGKDDTGGQSVSGNVSIARWVSKLGSAGNELTMTVREEGANSEVGCVAKTDNYVERIRLHRRCKVTVASIDNGFVEVYLNDG